MVMGKGKNPNQDHLIKLGTEAKMSKKLIDGITDQTKFAVNKWDSLANEYGMSERNTGIISRSINKI